MVVSKGYRTRSSRMRKKISFKCNDNAKIDLLNSKLFQIYKVI